MRIKPHQPTYSFVLSCGAIVVGLVHFLMGMVLVACSFPYAVSWIFWFLEPVSWIFNGSREVFDFVVGAPYDEAFLFTIGSIGKVWIKPRWIGWTLMLSGMSLLMVGVRYADRERGIRPELPDGTLK